MEHHSFIDHSHHNGLSPIHIHGGHDIPIINGIGDSHHPNGAIHHADFCQNHNGEQLPVGAQTVMHTSSAVATIAAPHANTMLVSSGHDCNVNWNVSKVQSGVVVDAGVGCHGSHNGVDWNVNTHINNGPNSGIGIGGSIRF